MPGTSVARDVERTLNRDRDESDNGNGRVPYQPTDERRDAEADHNRSQAVPHVVNRGGRHKNELGSKFQRHRIRGEQPDQDDGYVLDTVNTITAFDPASRKPSWTRGFR